MTDDEALSLSSAEISDESGGTAAGMRIVVRGVVDLATATQLAEELSACIDSGARLIVLDPMTSTSLIRPVYESSWTRGTGSSRRVDGCTSAG